MFNYGGIGSVFAMVWDYFLAGVIGVVLSCVTVLIINQTRAAWTWGFVLPVITVIGLPAVHSPGEFLFGSLVATTLTLLWMVVMVVKGNTAGGDRGLRDACKNKRFRIAASVYIGYCTICAFVDGPPVSFVAALTVLIAMWWNEGLKVFIQDLIGEAEQGQ